MNEEIRKFLEKADHALIVAEDLMARGHAPDAASKTYYAMFYAAQALLKSEQIEVVKHSAVESALGYSFIKTGKIERKYHRMLINARKIREIADYDIAERGIALWARWIREGDLIYTVVLGASSRYRLWESAETLAELGTNPELSISFQEPPVKKYRLHIRKSKKI